MIKIVGTDAAGTTNAELVLVRDDKKPTALLIGLAALELSIDVLIGYTAYRLWRSSHL